MKAVIAVPPVSDFYFTPTRASALGAITVRNLLKEEGINVRILNFPVTGKKPAVLPLPPELDYLRPHLIPGEHGPVSYFSTYKRFGPDNRRCAEMIAAESPDILLVSCFAWAYAEDAVSFTAAVREIMPDIPIAAGGAGVSAATEYFRRCGLFDYLLPGEAETVIPAFIKALKRNSSDFLPDIPSGQGDAGPEFCWNSTGFSKKRNMLYASAMLTRGCPKSCRFCSNYIVHGRRFRKAAPGSVRKELAAIPDKHNLHLNFEDDNLLFDREYFFEILNMVKERFPDAEFSAENGLDYTLLDADCLNKLIGYGFRSFNLSMASVNQGLLRQENRESSAELLTEILMRLKHADIPSVTYFICGLEGESLKSVADNLLFLHRLPTLSGISLFYPVPGLPAAYGREPADLPPRLSAGSSAWPWTGSMTTSDLITAFRLSRLSNLMKTVSGRIPGQKKRKTANLDGEIIKKTRSEQRLFTLSENRLTEIPYQNREMVDRFLDLSAGHMCY